MADTYTSLYVEANNLTELNAKAAQGWRVVDILQVGATLWALLKMSSATPAHTSARRK